MFGRAPQRGSGSGYHFNLLQRDSKRIFILSFTHLYRHREARSDLKRHFFKAKDEIASSYLLAMTTLPKSLIAKTPPLISLKPPINNLAK
jgi:hypothetical protein